MSDDNRFDYILARSRARESSTLTIATVAASASVVLIVLFIQAKVEAEINDYPEAFGKYEQGIAIMGMLFVLAGIVYREVTKYSIHRNDERWLRRWLSTCYKRDLIDKKGKKIEDPLYYNRGNRTREMGLRSLLLMPILAWWFILFSIDNHLVLGMIILSYIGYPIALSLCERKYVSSTD